MINKEILESIKKQNRIHFFETKKGNLFLYDAFSQNIFSVSKEFENLFNYEYTQLSNLQEKNINSLLKKLNKWNGENQNFVNLLETHVTINFSNKCNLNCTYCYRHKDNKNVMSIEKAYDVLDYVNKYYKVNNNEIIFSLDMTAEAFLDYDKIIQFDDKLADYENLYIEESDIVTLPPSIFLEKIKKDLYFSRNSIFTGEIYDDLNKIILDNNLFRYFKDKEKVYEILKKGNYDPEFLDKKRLLRMNRELLETFYSEYLKHKNYQQFRIWFMSNGTNISNKEIELIKKIRIDPFWISLDGPEEIHNQNRQYYDKKGSHKDIIQNIKLLQKNNINVKISCVLTSNYPYPDKLYKYFKNLSIKAIQICPIRNGSKISFTQDNIEMLKKGYSKLYDLIFSEVNCGDFTSFSLLNEDISMLALKNLFQRIRQNSRCTWGNEIVLDSEGNIYPCLYVIGQNKYLLGNINDKRNSEEILQQVLVTDMDKCPSCWARFLCGGTCHYNSIQSNGNIYKIDDTECQIRKHIITESIKFLLALIENNVNMNKVQEALFS